MRKKDVLGTWISASILVGAPLLAVITSINPWIIGGCAGALIIVVEGLAWMTRRRRRRRSVIDE